MDGMKKGPLHTEPVKGRVKGTGWPIDGHVLIFAKWRYDNYENWHLFDWETEDDDAIRDTFFQSMVEAGFCTEGERKAWNDQWKANTSDVPGAFTLDLDQVEIVENQ